MSLMKTVIHDISATPYLVIYKVFLEIKELASIAKKIKSVSNTVMPFIGVRKKVFIIITTSVSSDPRTLSFFNNI